MKLNDTILKPTYCKGCLNKFTPSPMRYLIEQNPLICDECIKKITKDIHIEKHYDVKILFLSTYDCVLKDFLMNYKEYGDIELAGCFLYIFLPLIKAYFHNYLFIPLPSSKERIKKRGFSHLNEILKASKLNFDDVLEKESHQEQKNINNADRFRKKGIYLKNPSSIQNKKIVLFDDVFTSGATFLESLKVVKEANPKTIKGLIIMNNYNKSKFIKMT